MSYLYLCHRSTESMSSPTKSPPFRCRSPIPIVLATSWDFKHSHWPLPLSVDFLFSTSCFKWWCLLTFLFYFYGPIPHNPPRAMALCCFFGAFGCLSRRTGGQNCLTLRESPIWFTYFLLSRGAAPETLIRRQATRHDCLLSLLSDEDK